MKNPLLAFLILLLSVSEVLAQTGGQTPLKPNQVLFDFRTEKRSNPQKIPAATQRSVLSKVFKKYLTDESKCNANFDSRGDDYLKAARNAGQIVPSIIDMTPGSFTAPGQTQTAYVISVSECNASHADNFGTKRVAIFAGQQLIVDMDADFKSSIVRKTDLNGDGIDELLMVSGDMNQGILVEMATLYDFQKGRLNVIEDFGTVTEDACASQLPGSGARAAVLSIGASTPGRIPKLRTDIYGSSCRNVKKWRFIKTGKMPE